MLKGLIKLLLLIYEKLPLTAGDVNYLGSGESLPPPLEKEEIKGIKVTRLGVRRWRDSIVESKDPRNSPYYWMYSGLKEDIAGENTDIATVKEGYVSVTPVLLDRTDQKAYTALQKRYEEK